jgi:hypothetical protein
MFTYLSQRVLWLGRSDAECAGPGECSVLEQIRGLHAHHDGVVGSPRMWEDLRYAGERCGRHRVARLMPEPDCTECRSVGSGGRRPQGPPQWDPESSGPGLPRGSPHHQMGH